MLGQPLRRENMGPSEGAVFPYDGAADGVGGALIVGGLTSLSSGQGLREGFNRAGCFTSILGAMLLIYLGRHFGWSF